MTTSAVSSALGGIAAAQAWFDASARTVARAGLDSPAQPAGGGGDLIDGIVGTTLAAQAAAVNVAVLGTTLRTEHSLLDIIV